MFSEEHSFSKTQLIKPLFHPCQKETPFFKKERCHFRFWAISGEPPNFKVFPGFHYFGPKKTVWPKQIVRTKMRGFLSLTQKASGKFCPKNTFFQFLDDHLKSTIYIVFFCLYHYVYIRLMTDLLPTFLVQKARYHPKIDKKMPKFWGTRSRPEILPVSYEST